MPVRVLFGLDDVAVHPSLLEGFKDHADDLNMTTCSDQQIMSSIQQNDPIIWWRINRDPKLEQELRDGLAVVLAAYAGTPFARDQRGRGSGQPELLGADAGEDEFVVVAGLPRDAE